VGWHIDESDQPTRPARPTPPTIGRPPTRMSLLSLRVISRALKVINDVSRRHHRYRSGGTLKRRRRGSKQVRERAERVLAAPRSVDITSTATVFSGKPGRTPAARRPRAPPAPCPDPVPASGVFLHRCRTARSGVDRSHSGGPPRGPAGPGRPAPGRPRRTRLPPRWSSPHRKGHAARRSPLTRSGPSDSPEPMRGTAYALNGPRPHPDRSGEPFNSANPRH